MTSPQPQARDEVERLAADLRKMAEVFSRVDQIMYQNSIPTKLGPSAAYTDSRTALEAASTLTAQARELEVMRSVAELAAWRFDYIAKLAERDSVVKVIAPSLREAADDIRAALNSGGAEERASPPSSQSSGGEP